MSKQMSITASATLRCSGVIDRIARTAGVGDVSEAQRYTAPTDKIDHDLGHLVLHRLL